MEKLSKVPEPGSFTQIPFTNVLISAFPELARIELIKIFSDNQLIKNPGDVLQILIPIVSTCRKASIQLVFKVNEGNQMDITLLKRRILYDDFLELYFTPEVNVQNYDPAYLKDFNL